MKLETVLSKVGNVIHYLLSGRKRKLYKQWVEMAELPPEDIPGEEVGSRITEEEEGKDETQLRLTALFMMQGATLVLLLVVLILLIVQSC
jgi:hypothetical protein